MFRSILLPTLVVSAIAFPLLYQKSTSRNSNSQFRNANNDYDYYVANPSGGSGSYSPFQTQRTNPSVNIIPASTPSTILGGSSTTTTSSMPQLSTGAIPGIQGGPFLTASNSGTYSTPGVDFSQMTPDYGAVETQIFRGNAYGPDLTSQPIQFAPVSDFKEIFRFDVSPTWAKQRWERLTTIPVENGLHGLRTALVTGTNSWDLNGSLTYFFDQNHRPQRITFRGWVGDPSRLVNLATQHFGLKSRPTHWAGLYLANFGGAQTGGLLMKDPDTIDRRNQVQRTAVIMEINQPAGGFKLSNEFLGFLASAVPGQ